jgi:hypothetical protein
LDYVIWSFEHDAWWRPGGWGYTNHLAEAGRYTADDATRIVRKANVCTIHEQAFPVYVAEAYEQRGWHCLMPGAYADRERAMHIVMPEMLLANGYRDTPEHRETLEHVIRTLWPGAVLVED